MTRRIEGNTLIILDDKGNDVLTIKVIQADDVTMLVTSGSINHDVAPEFEDELMSILTSGCDVAVDFTALEHISAPALNALLSVQKLVDNKRYKFYIQNLSASVKKIFEDTGFIDLLEIR